MKQSDKEFLCYLICLSWDRLDDEDKIKANKMMLAMHDKEPDTEYIVQENGKELYKVSLPTDEPPLPRNDVSERRGGPPDNVFYYNEGYAL